MGRSATQPPRAAQARDAAVVRLRRTTQLAGALMVAAGAAFTAFAAGSTHTKHVLARRPARIPSAAVLLRAPAPPLVGAESAPPAAPEAPAQVTAPAPTYEPPVVVSGGS